MASICCLLACDLFFPLKCDPIGKRQTGNRREAVGKARRSGNILGVGAWTLITFLVASRPRDVPRVSQLSLCNKPPPNLGPNESNTYLVRDSAGQHYGVQLAVLVLAGPTHLSVVRCQGGWRLTGPQRPHFVEVGWLWPRVMGVTGICVPDPAAGQWGYHRTMAHAKGKKEQKSKPPEA